MCTPHHREIVQGLAGLVGLVGGGGAGGQGRVGEVWWVQGVGGRGVPRRQSAPRGGHARVHLQDL